MMSYLGPHLDNFNDEQSKSYFILSDAPGFASSLYTIQPDYITRGVLNHEFLNDVDVYQLSVNAGHTYEILLTSDAARYGWLPGSQSSSSLEFDIQYQYSFTTSSSQPYYGLGSSNDDYLQFTAPSTGIIEVKIHDPLISFGSPIYDYAVTVFETAPLNTPALWTLVSNGSWDDANQDGDFGVGETITAPTWSAVDVDGVTTSISPSFFTINSGVRTDYVLTTTYTPTNADIGATIYAYGSFLDGFGNLETSSPTLLGTVPNYYSISGIIDLDARYEQLIETSQVGTAVGITASASDSDATGNSVSYSLSSDAGGLFSINPSSGVVTLSGSLTMSRLQVTK